MEMAIPWALANIVRVNALHSGNKFCVYDRGVGRKYLLRRSCCQHCAFYSSVLFFLPSNEMPIDIYVLVTW